MIYVRKCGTCEFCINKQVHEFEETGECCFVPPANLRKALDRLANVYVLTKVNIMTDGCSCHSPIDGARR